MDTVLEQINKQEHENRKKSPLNKIKFIYQIYHFAAKVFLYSILCILILVAVGFILYFFDLQKNIKSGDYKQPLFGAYIIISPSMVPTINVYDAIIIKRTEVNQLKENDIITFVSNDSRYSGLTITHRIIGIEKSQSGEYYFRTKGDNNNVEDSALVKSDDIFGKVILKIPKLGYIQQILTTSFGWLLLIIIPCIGVVIYDIIKILLSITNIRSLISNLSSQTEVKNVDDDIEIIDEIERKNTNNINMVNNIENLERNEDYLKYNINNNDNSDEIDSIDDIN